METRLRRRARPGAGGDLQHAEAIGQRQAWTGGGIRYVGSTWADEANTFKNDDYLLVDAAIRYDFGNLYQPFAGATFMLSANNLFDKQYYTCFSLFDCNWGSGRTVYATLGFRW